MLKICQNSKDHMHWKHVPLSNGSEDPENHNKDIDSALIK